MSLLGHLNLGHEMERYVSIELTIQVCLHIFDRIVDESDTVERAFSDI